MKVIFKDYLTHTSVQFLFLALLISLAAISELAVWGHWPWLVLVVVSAPFYEWITHKFVLHACTTDTISTQPTARYSLLRPAPF